MLPGHSSWGSGPVWEKLWSQLLTHCGLLSILGVPAQEPETVSRATAPTDQPAGGKGMWKRVPVGGPCFMVWVSRKERSEMLGQVSWGGGAGLRICGAQRFSGDMRVQEDSLSCRVRGRASSCHSLVPTHPVQATCNL